MLYQVEFSPYSRQFKQPLITKHGIWHLRRGIILRLTCPAGQVGLGEIAPLEWFGSERFDQALDFCDRLAPEITAEQIFSIPAELPACQFGLESAWEALKLGASSLERNGVMANSAQLPLCGLLPTGEAALCAWQDLWNQGYRSFKWKIGVAPLQTEIANFQRLSQALPPEAKLRLDANGGLSDQEAQQWLQVCDSAGIEFLEQPLPEDQLDAIVKLSRKYKTPIALDESVATLPQLQACYDQGWRGIFVIKPAIAGSLCQLREFCQQPSLQAVFSSVFETAVGRQAALKLATELSSPGYAIGFGTHHWFKDELDAEFADFKNLWNHR